MLHLNDERGTCSQIKVTKQTPSLKQHSGILYVISNNAYPTHVKIGITKDLPKRLVTYQAYDPFRNFKVEKYVFIMDVRRTERYLLDEYKLNDTFTGEWIPIDNLNEISQYMNNC